MKKAIISTGGKQYLVSEGETLDVELIKQTGKNLDLETLLVIDDDKISIGKPILADIKVQAEIIESDVKAEKVTAIRYKAKKRVHKVHGHRQHHTILKIKKIG
jgi:large subunit ribosomal protein L21